MEQISHEAPAVSLQEVYEQNHVELLDLMGRIVAGLARNYRTDKPRSAEHIGAQEEMKAMLTDIADYLQA